MVWSMKTGLSVRKRRGGGGGGAAGATEKENLTYSFYVIINYSAKWCL